MFGFGEDLDEEYTSDDSAVELTASADNTSTDAEVSPVAVEAVVVEAPAIDPKMTEQIFQGVLEVFNSALPDFLARSVDLEAQKQLLLESLDASLKQYLNDLMVSAERYAESRLRNESEMSRREAERLRTEMQQLEQQRTSLREQQLSADRRRRALADRVNDLEGKLEAADAEREQLQLENKSMLNKLKVADVQPGVVEEMSRCIDDLRAQLAAKEGNAPTTVGSASESSNSITESTAAAEAAAENKQLQEALAATQADLEKSRAELAELQQRIADNQTQAEMVQTMYNDLHNQYVNERQARESIENELTDSRNAFARLEQELSDGKAACVSLEQELTDSRSACKDLEKELAEASGLLEQVNEMQEQFGKVEAAIHKRDERIEKLKATNKRLREELASARNQLSAADEVNLFAIAETEATAKSEAPKDLPPLEDDFEVPEWFVSEPGPDAPSLQTSSEPFGYSQPVKKPRKPDSDAQMTLF